MNRRQLLRGAGLAVAGSVSGCLDIGASRSSSAPCSSPFEAVTGENWPMNGRDAANTGHAPVSTGGLSERRPLFTSDTDQRPLAPIVADETLYLPLDRPDDRSAVRAIDLVDATASWSLERKDRIQQPAYAGGRLLFVSSNRSADDAQLTAVDADDGTERWTFDLGGKSNSPPIVADGTVYASRSRRSGDGVLFAIDVETGEQRWSSEPSPLRSAPAVAGGNLYLPAEDEHFVSVDGDSGDRVWSLSGDDGFSLFDDEIKINNGWSPTVHDGTVFVGEYTGIRAVDACTGETRWFTDTVENRRQTGVYGSPAVVDGTVYVTAIQDREDFTGWALALDAETGERRWRTELGIMHVSEATDPVVTDDAVVVTTDPKFQDRTKVLDRHDGTVRRRIEMGGEVVIVGSHLFIAHYDGLFGFELSAGS